RLPQPATELAQGVKRQWAAETAGQSTQNLPILACFAWREDSSTPQLRAPLGVDVGAILLRIGGAWKHDIRATRPAVAVMSLIDDKGRSEISCVNLVGSQKIEHLDVPRAAPCEDALDIEATRPRHKAKVQPGNSRRRA